GKSADLEILGRHLSAVLNDLVFNRLTLVEGAQTSALNSRNMNENVLTTTAALRLDEPVAFGRVEPFNSTGSHSVSPIGDAANIAAELSSSSRNVPVGGHPGPRVGPGLRAPNRPHTRHLCRKAH